MSCFICQLCDRHIDSDFIECHEFEDGLICEDCNDIAEGKTNALSLEDAAKITKPLFYDPPGLGLYWSPGKQLTEEEHDAQEKRFIDSAVFLEVK